eukprot:Hpha_TRINITY_DN15531_c4_g1::TRINITY_DN15531_c4_g1_i1::g.105454::m.105454
MRRSSLLVVGLGVLCLQTVVCRAEAGDRQDVIKQSNDTDGLDDDSEFMCCHSSGGCGNCRPEGSHCQSRGRCLHSCGGDWCRVDLAPTECRTCGWESPSCCVPGTKCGDGSECCDCGELLCECPSTPSTPSPTPPPPAPLNP